MLFSYMSKFYLEWVWDWVILLQVNRLKAEDNQTNLGIQSGQSLEYSPHIFWKYCTVQILALRLIDTICQPIILSDQWETTKMIRNLTSITVSGTAKLRGKEKKKKKEKDQPLKIILHQQLCDVLMERLNFIAVPCIIICFSFARGKFHWCSYHRGWTIMGNGRRQLQDQKKNTWIQKKPKTDCFYCLGCVCLYLAGALIS